jgi:Zn ribbon nucleic-acid-binding protein
MYKCPKCKSEDTIVNSWAGNGRGYLERSLTCNKCGYAWKEISEGDDKNDKNK